MNLRSRRWEVFGSKKKTGGVPLFLALTTSKGMLTVTYMRTVQPFLALTTGRAFMATKAVGAFVKVKLGINVMIRFNLYSFLFFLFLIQTSMNAKREAMIAT